ncbi:MAG: YihY family inner membrane protein [Gammaproteobacteria bacterium]|nr:YihY family inner membrane protein [Gammaproteobacteria bacterium]MDH3406081.1 YihY family inner membrane protein [Gammaproteobacteria bacterium]MDH3563502.1 YihY family inner membrane protein [Gammaproteobacteria bacterium]
MNFFRAIPRLTRWVVQRFREDRCMRVAGSLSFTTLLAMVPMTAVTFALFSHFEIFQSWMRMTLGFFYGNFVPATGEAVSHYIQEFAANAGKLTAWGMLLLFLTSLMVMATIERVFNDIWHVPQTRRRLHRYLSYGVLLVLGPVLMGISLSSTSYLFSMPLFSRHTTLGELKIFLLAAAPVIFEWLAFWLLYVVVPNYRVRWRHGLIGSLLTTLLFEVAKRGFAYFVTHFTNYTALYGAVAALPVFLVWVYLSWTIILLGAVVTATLPEWRRPQAVREWRRRRPV